MPEFPDGEANPMARLTNATVSEIRSLYLMGDCSYVDLGCRFGLAISTVQHVINTDSWDHLLEPGQAQALARVREQRRNNPNLKHNRRYDNGS